MLASMPGWLPDWMQSAAWPFGVALAVTILAAPLVRRVSISLDLFDRPDAGLKPHERPVPFLGGVAMYLGWQAALVVAVWRGGQSQLPFGLLVLGGTALMLTGLVDDIRHLRPTLRLLLQCAVAAILLYADIGRQAVAAMLEPIGDAAVQFVGGGTVGVVLSAAFCAAVLAGATNATNLIDGLDGLCAGILAIAMLGFVATIALLDRSQHVSEVRGVLLVVICAAALASCLAFLLFNFNPASMFMGDSGSLLLGFNVAVVLVLLTECAAWRGLLAGLTVFAFPILDTALAVSRRWLNGRPLFTGDRSHLYDQIRDRGLSVRQTVLVCYGLGLAFAVAGAGLVLLPMTWLLPAFLAIPILAGACCWACGMLRVDDAAARSEA